MQKQLILVPRFNTYVDHMHKFFLIIFVFVVSLIPFKSDAAWKSATIYKSGSNYKDILYLLERDVQNKNNEKTVRVTFKNPNGKVVALEEFTYKEGKFKSYRQKHHQIGQDGMAIVDGDRLKFNLKEKNDDGEIKESRDDEDYKANTVSKDQIVGYLMEHWDDILKGESIHIRFMVNDRKETVGFKYFKEKETTYNGKPAIIIKMKPSSFIIAALVDPLYFTFEKNGARRLLEINGRVVPKQKNDDDWDDLDAITVYHYGKTPKS